MADSALEEDTDSRMLIQACLYDNTDLLRDLIQGGEHDINQVDCWGRTAVYTAVSNNSMNCLEILIASGADINRAPFESSCDKRTPLHAAVFDGKVEAVKLLLKYNANVNTRDGSGRTPLDIAKHTGNREIVAFLNAAREINKRERNELSQRLYSALSRRDVETVLHILQEKKAEDIKYIISHPPGDHFPALCSACKLGNLEIVTRLLTFHDSASELAHRETGYTPLHIACEHGNVQLIHLLLQKFPEQVVTHTVDHQLPLHKAAVCGMADAVHCLLHFPYGRDFSRRFSDPATGLSYWSSINVNEGDSNGRTALHLASEKGYLDVVQVLLGFTVNVDLGSKPRGASNSNKEHLSGCGIRDSSRSDEGGFSRSDEGGFSGSDRWGTLSSEEGRVKGENSHRQSGLHPSHSSVSGAPESPSSLSPGSSSVGREMICPVNVNLVTTAGHTALHLAIKGRHHNIAQLLLEAGADVKLAVQLKDSRVSLLTFTLTHGDAALFELMMRYKAEDINNTVMKEASRHGNYTIQQLLLQHRSSRDLTRVINKSEMKLQWCESQLTSGSSLASFPDRTSSLDADHRAVFPIHSVAINWQNIGDISEMSEHTLRQACFLHNSAMQRMNSLPLFAITKIDISKNAFDEVPRIIFDLFSLCVLNASGNRIKAFPSDEDVQDSVCSMVLEEIHLNDNCIESVPSYLFQLPKLKQLNLSKNKLKTLPIEMWTAPMLAILNLSRNKLSSLPYISISDFVSGPSPKTKANSMTTCNSETDSHAPGDSDSVYSIMKTNPVQHINRWRAGVPVNQSQLHKSDGQKYLGIRQLDLSRNRFTEIPLCLACCAPQLEVLSLQDNMLNSVGLLSNLPESLLELNLSHCGLVALDQWSHQIGYDQPCLGFKL